MASTASDGTFYVLKTGNLGPMHRHNLTFSNVKPGESFTDDGSGF